MVPVWRSWMCQGWVPGFYHGYLGGKIHYHHPQEIEGCLCTSRASGTAYMGESCCFSLLCCWNCILGVMRDPGVLESQRPEWCWPQQPQKGYWEMCSPARDYFSPETCSDECKRIGGSREPWCIVVVVVYQQQFDEGKIKFFVGLESVLCCSF